MAGNVGNCLFPEKMSQGRVRQSEEAIAGMSETAYSNNDLSINVDNVCILCWGGQKVLISTIDLSINVSGKGGSCWMAGQVRHLVKCNSWGSQKVLNNS